MKTSCRLTKRDRDRKNTRKLRYCTRTSRRRGPPIHKQRKSSQNWNSKSMCLRLKESWMLLSRSLAQVKRGDQNEMFNEARRAHSVKRRDFSEKVQKNVKNRKSFHENTWKDEKNGKSFNEKRQTSQKPPTNYCSPKSISVQRATTILPARPVLVSWSTRKEMCPISKRIWSSAFLRINTACR